MKRFGAGWEASRREGNRREGSLWEASLREGSRIAGWSGARRRDFEDFVAGDPGRGAGRLPLPDPSFRERLRRRLWQIQVLTRRTRGWAHH